MAQLQNDSAIDSTKVPLRSEVRIRDTWDLTPLYPSDGAWEEAFQKVSETFGDIEKFKGRLHESPGVLRDALEFEKSLDMSLEQLNQYAALKTTEDSSNDEALTREARLQNLFVRVGEVVSFLSPEIQQLSDSVFASYLEAPALEEWVIPLRKLRRLKPHTLSAREERLLALAGASLAGHQEVFSQLTNVDMQFGELKDSSGRLRPLTQSSFSGFLEDPQREVRKEAFHQFYQEFSAHRYTLAAALANSVRTDVFQARARNYPSALKAALFGDDIPLAVYENLISTVHSHMDDLYRYYALRKKVLKLDANHVYDNYVPLVADLKSRVSFDEAIEKVVASLDPLGSEYTSVLRQGLRAQRWCDRYENRGKRSGAFSYGTYTSPPYIMMNYKEDVFSDVFTLAHEAGHSMHTWYSQRHQSYQNYHYPIFLAEVASTFNECLLTDHLLKNTDDPRMKAFLLSRQLNDIRSTLHRQTMFAEFERDIHRVDEEGGALTLEEFRRIYRRLLERYFGPDFVLDEELELECLRIPHFYNAFYVYKYATGISAAIALSEQVLQTGETSNYLEFLRSGGSRFPMETLRAAGVDMGTPAPIEAALRLFSRRVDELASLLNT